MNNLLVVFILCNIANVIIQTIKSLATIKCGKGVASVINALAYGFYTYIVILMVCELPLLTKCLIVGACNLIGVYVVKDVEERLRKDKLWLVKVTVKEKNLNNIIGMLTCSGISYSVIQTNKMYVVLDCYCETKKQTSLVKDFCERCGGKLFATESKI